jgi:hypothetical protein
LYLPHRADFSRYLSRHSQNLARVKHVLWNQEPGYRDGRLGHEDLSVRPRGRRLGPP